LSTFRLSAEFKTNVYSISRREGLSNGAVNAIARDVEGYIWFGTWNGLNRYNGSNIDTYLPGNSPGSIHNHVIRELYPSPEGPVWILTNKGIALYDNVHDRFSPFFTRESEQINYETDIALGYSHPFGTLASVYGSGIYRYDSISGFVKIAFDEASRMASLQVKRLHLSGNQAYCITEAGQLMRITGSHLDRVVELRLTGVITATVSAMAGQRPVILITQRTGPAMMIDPASGEVRVISLPDDVITAFALSRESSRVWAGTEKGRLYSLDLSTLKFEALNRFSGVLTNNPIATRILSIYESEPDILWIGTDGNGVFTLKLMEFPNQRLPSDRLAYPIVRSILVSRTGDMLVGTKGGGIDIFNSRGDHIRGLTEKDGLTNNSVLSFHERSDGSIWVGTDGSGVDIISPDYKTIRNFPRDFKVQTPLSFASVYRILEDNDQNIFLGTSGYGVIMVEFDRNTALPISLEQVNFDKNVDATWPQKQIVYALTVEKPGIIWIGTRGAGVYRYNTITKRIIAQYSTLSDPGLIRNDDILSLNTDLAGNIWAGSSNGIFSLQPVSADSARVTGMNNPTDLSNTSIHAIQVDGPGNLWVTTNLGLSMIDISNRNVRNFNVNDGLINFEYSDGASFFDKRTERLYVGGTMGVDMIQTDQMKFSSYFPPIAINQLYIRNMQVDIGSGSVLQSRINHQEKLELRYNQNSLSFYVTPLAYWGRERYRISYRLLNFDDEWIVNPPDQHISFSNLKPGKYTFQVRVSDENGTWSVYHRETEIIINPPPWLTGWAIAGYILLAIGIQLLIFSAYRRREARKKEAILQAFQKKKEEELQSYKIEFFTNVAHEFRTPLTLISSHIHAMLEDTRNSAPNPRLLKIFNNSIKLQKLVLEIIQFRKLEKGKEPLQIRLTRPAELVNEVVSDLELLAEQRNIRCEVIAPEPHRTFRIDSDKFQRIMTNLVSNAIKYNREGGFVKVYVRYENDALIAEVEDNGVGIKPEYMLKVFEPFGITSAREKGSFPGYRSTGLGLAVTRGLVELMTGTITFRSKPDEGTRFTCVFPDVHELSPELFGDDPADEYIESGFIDDPGPGISLESGDPTDGKPVVLLVDDDPEILALLKDLLAEEYNLLFAANGLEAFNKVVAEKPDLIVSDVMMPVMDGIEFCRKIRENFDTSHIPIILLAAKGEIEDRIAGLKAGADSYIPKPFHPEHLKVRLSKLLQLRTGIMSRFGKHDDNPALVKEIPDPFLQKLLDYIDKNIDDEALSSEKICDMLAISKSSLYNKTRTVLGTTPHSLIYQRRLSKAVTLLKSTAMTVSEVIDQTGFASRTHFYELFNKVYGCSPSDYRKSSRN
jgi:signal transduction histidine kinase/CheY-like chemotaxis protein/ligand-binding sensor domain-containing protein/AraC-like DNA-binding protein